MPKVSILVPAFNAERFICEAVRSVLCQNIDCEVIVVDDSSTDRTYEVARALGPDVRVERAIRKGAQAARNQALMMASGDYVKYLDADDVLLPDCLRYQVELNERLQGHQITYGPAIRMKEDGRMDGVCPHRPRPAGMDNVAHILYYSPLTACPLHRRNLLLSVGGMDESLPREHENDLHIRLTLAGVEFMYDDRPVYGYRQHTSHVSLMKGGVTRFGAGWMLKYLQAQEARIRDHFQSNLPEDVVIHLALFYWKSGRSVLREGAVSEAAAYFANARRVSSSRYICGKMPYRFLVSLFGPIHAERIMGLLRGRSRS